MTLHPPCGARLLLGGFTCDALAQEWLLQAVKNKPLP